MPQALDPIVINDLRGGRNGTDSPMGPAFLPNQCVEALNVDWKDTTFARKRGGSTSVTDTGGTAFSSGIQSVIRHVPGASEAAAEFWGIDGAATPIVKRMAAGTSFANVTLADAIATKPQDVTSATLNGKLFLTYDSTVDRLHAWDGTSVRRVGLIAVAAAPTAANTGSGSYAAVLRYYRVRWLHLSGTTVIRRSEPSASVSFTPSGSGTHARVTRPTAASEGETHWEIEASTDNAVFYRLSQIAIATTTYDDSAVTTTYANNTLSDRVGTYVVPTSGKYLLTDGNRLLIAGGWETGAKNSRVTFTPVLGSSDQGDDERIPNTTVQKNWVDLNENDGGFITALGGPLNGVPLAFKYRQVYRLVPTGDVVAPYLPRRVRDDIGCVAHKTVCVGEDQAGRPALYWLSHNGPYRYGIGGIEYLGRDNEDIWRAINLAASTVVAHAVYYPNLHQLWLWIATGESNDPDTKMIFDVRHGVPDENGHVRGGWAQHSGLSAAARCSVLMSNTLGASMSRDLKPYIGRASGTTLAKCDTTDVDDLGTDFQAYVKTKPLHPAQSLGFKVGLGEPCVLAKAASGVMVTVTSDRDFGKEQRSHQQILTAEQSETRVVRKFDGAGIGEADVVQLTIGDDTAREGAWSIDAVWVPPTVQEIR